MDDLRLLTRVVDEGCLTGAMRLAHRGLEPIAKAGVENAKLTVLVRPGVAARLHDPLSANMRETNSSTEFCVEGEPGMSRERSIEIILRLGDRSVIEGKPKAFHRRVQAEGHA